MKPKRLAVLACGLALLGLAAALQSALNPAWQSSLVNFIFLAILLCALEVFASEMLWAPISAWVTTVLVYDLALLIRPPLPGILVWMFAGLAFLGSMLYLSVGGQNLKDLNRTLKDLLDGNKFRAYRALLLALFPAWAAALVLAKTSTGLASPDFPRTIHPAPPDQSDFKGRGTVLATLENPFRRFEKEDPEKFRELLGEGKKVYYQNCFFCHGDHLDGQGPFAPALNPLPANFQDPGTIAMLQESFVFWRVAKGGPGLPASAHPWSSAMPAWEKILSEEELWKAILWLYAYTNQAPRTFAPIEH